ncbi:MAG: hypothetical protein A3H28_11005 [Acidobacteria bacterium RIFCSPLOWO2_02_FULL_61_28]|nr:MAG: hypothetical protein A3H28_11005 [Acidobacteria bacterium RIFCSPLOWO2_02_FULL_61_28]
MEKLLNELVQRLQEAYGGDLVSVVLYGSAASGDQQGKFSDLNVICVLNQVGVAELRKGDKAMQWWIKQKQPAPLMLSAEEVREAQDVFPIESLDIHQSHRVLYGEEMFARISVERTSHRLQVEHELRSTLLRLRQRYLSAHSSDKDVVQLMAKSLATVATLARHALILAGLDAPAKKREVLEATSQRFALDPAPFRAVLGVREGTEKPAGEQVHSLFAAYLEQVRKLAQAVDRL